MLSRGSKSLQTSCSGNGAYNVIRTSTCHMDWDAGGESQGISVCTSLRDTELSPLSLNVLYLQEHGAVGWRSRSAANVPLFPP